MILYKKSHMFSSCAAVMGMKYEIIQDEQTRMHSCY